MEDTRHPIPPYPEQQQEPPGKTVEMKPVPDHGEKSYKGDGKLTGKVRGNLPIAHDIAGFFGGGGHAYSAGFKVYESYDTIMKELVTATDKALQNYESTLSQSTD